MPIGVAGDSAGSFGRGVVGWATHASGNTHGVSGQSESTSGRGVYGYAPATSGTTFGVMGQADSSSGFGIAGLAPADSGATRGVYGWAKSASGSGVIGYSGTSVIGPAPAPKIGVYGYADHDTASVGVKGTSPSGTGVLGTSGASGGGSALAGVTGISGVADVDRPGVYGEAPRRGVWGRAYESNTLAVAVYGQHDGNGKGVVGMSAGGSMPSDLVAAGVVGYGWGTPGVYARSDLAEAVYAESNSSTPAGRFFSWGHGVGLSAGSGGGPPTRDRTGVVGYAGQDAQSVGVWGESFNGEGVHGRAPSGVGVLGESVTGTAVIGRTETRSGVYGFSGVEADWGGPTGTSKTGVFGYAIHENDTSSRGVWGYGPIGIGVYGRSDTGTAGSFSTPVSGPTGLHTGTALVADGRVKFPNCVGVALIAPGTKSVTVAPGIDLTSSSAVVATLMGSAGGTTSVHRVSVNATTNAFTIYLTANSTAAANVKVAWHVFG